MGVAAVAVVIPIGARHLLLQTDIAIVLMVGRHHVIAQTILGILH